MIVKCKNLRGEGIAFFFENITRLHAMPGGTRIQFAPPREDISIPLDFDATFRLWTYLLTNGSPAAAFDFDTGDVLFRQVSRQTEKKNEEARFKAKDFLIGITAGYTPRL